MKVGNFIEFILDHSLEDERIDEIYDGNALAGELGELNNILKKKLTYELIPEYKKRVDNEIAAGLRLDFKEQITDEAGDILFYFLRILDRNDISIEEVIDAQVNKVRGKSISKGGKFKK